MRFNLELFSRWTIGALLFGLAAALTWLANETEDVYRALIGWLCLAPLGMLAITEFYRMAGAKLTALPPVWWPPLAAGATWLAALFVPLDTVLIWLLCSWIAMAVALLLGSATAIMGTLFFMSAQFLWIVLPVSMALGLWSKLLGGPIVVFGSLIVVKGADTVAFMVGRRWGRRLLAPVVSPRKSWEGVAAALCFAAVSGVFVIAWPLQVAWWVGVIIGSMLGIAGVVGDLFESAIKRACNCKDSGALPGLGGALDMLDAMLLAWPALWLVLYFGFEQATIYASLE